MRLIDADALINELVNSCNNDQTKMFPVWIEKQIDAQPTVVMLKEQEAKPVDLYGKDDWYGLVCVCPDCKAEWMGDESETHFCPNCGRKVKWND